MRKIVLNIENCIGCGACISLDEEHFDYDDTGLSKVKSQENLDTEELANAIEACPTAVISLIESDEDEETNELVEEATCSPDGCEGCTACS